MKDGFAPLIMALVMVLFASIFWYASHSQRSETIQLAAEVEAFLEDHRTESTDHFTAQQKARKLLNLAQSPNRSFLILLCLILAVQALTTFFKNAKGRNITTRAAQIWTWRP